MRLSEPFYLSPERYPRNRSATGCQRNQVLRPGCQPNRSRSVDHRGDPLLGRGWWHAKLACGRQQTMSLFRVNHKVTDTRSRYQPDQSSEIRATLHAGTITVIVNTAERR